MEQNAAREMVWEIMAEFVHLTGLADGQTPQRYLWTDAFAVCNFLELYRQTREEKYKQLALRLVDQVHHVLGRHRADDPRTGWISGLAEPEGEQHPTRGGLRIGKVLNERKPGEPIDERLEWDRDGQYYHYLTKWMHALSQVSRVTGEATYLHWAIELAKTAHTSFTYQPSSSGRKRMVWKMSIDLSYPLVPLMGQHDPLDGLITYLQLQATTPKEAEHPTWPDLRAEIADMAGICAGKNWATDDPLGLGGLLADAYKIAQLIAHQSLKQFDLLETLLDASLVGLQAYASQDALQLPVDFRLAFRELGLSIGLRAVERLQGLVKENPGLFKERVHLHSRLAVLSQYTPLAENIETFWLERPHREAESWLAHREINMVMLATSLDPDGYLNL
ncbi:MAG: hypothetical protein DPW09_03140 [Anaerolineae bacterium]|nr:hypothetical protein [Anaerolineae bacterium]